MNTTTQLSKGSKIYWHGQKCIVTNSFVCKGRYIQISPVGNGDNPAKYYQVSPDEVTEHDPIEFTRINNDMNGNPRFVCHFLAFVNNNDRETLGHDYDLSDLYNIAIRKSRQLGGKKFHNKQYGGGIVFQMYNGEKAEMSRKIREIANK